MKAITKKTLIWLTCYGFFGLMSVLTESNNEDDLWARSRKDKTDHYIYFERVKVGINSIKLGLGRGTTEPSEIYHKCDILYKKLTDDSPTLQVEFDFSRKAVLIESLDAPEEYKFAPWCEKSDGSKFIGYFDEYGIPSTPEIVELAMMSDGMVSYKFEYGKEFVPNGFRVYKTPKLIGKSDKEYFRCYDKSAPKYDSNGKLISGTVRAINGHKICNPVEGYVKAIPSGIYFMNFVDSTGGELIAPKSSEDIEKYVSIESPTNSKKGIVEIPEIVEEIEEFIEGIFNEVIVDEVFEELNASWEPSLKLNIDKKAVAKIIEIFSRKFIEENLRKIINSLIEE